MLDTDPVVKASAFELFADHFFSDRQLLFDAIMSKGYPNEHPGLKPAHHQGVLANMGDAVIDVLATEFLIVERGMLDAGEITQSRERMVKGTSLKGLASKILPFVAMTSSERNELHNSSTSGESLEAMVGALYLDGGLLPVKRLLEKVGFFEQEI